MSDDLKSEILHVFEKWAGMGEREVQRCYQRVQAAEIRELSRLERVQAALPKGLTAREVAGVVVVERPAAALGTRHTMLYLWSYSPVTPEEAARMAARLAGVEDDDE